MQALEDEICRHQADIDELNHHSNELRINGVDNDDVTQGDHGVSHGNQTILQLNTRWQHLTSRLQTSQTPESTSTDVTSQEEVTSPEEETATSSEAISLASPVAMTTDTFNSLSENVQYLRTRLNDLQKQLSTSGLAGRQYEEFSSQEDNLKVRHT